MTQTGNNFFSYLYAVDVVGSNYRLKDSNQLVQGTQPAISGGVTVKDDVFNAGDLPNRLGEVGSDQFTVSGSIVFQSYNGEYTFYRAASINGSEGFVAQKAGAYYYFTDTAYTGAATPAARTLSLSAAGVDQWICFMRGTGIATPGGSARVEDLHIGDLVLTSDGRSAPVRWIGRQTVSTLFADENRLPVRIKTGALGDNVPCRDLLVSNDHGLLVEGVLVQAGALINGVTIVRERNVPTVFTYYHVELDDHSLILAENVPAETFVDNVERHAFDNWDAYQALYPAGRSVPEMDLPRVKAQRQLPSAVRRLILSRIKAIEVAAA